VAQHLRVRLELEAGFVDLSVHSHGLEIAKFAAVKS
jgi:hypothetical protein